MNEANLYSIVLIGTEPGRSRKAAWRMPATDGAWIVLLVVAARLLVRADIHREGLVFPAFLYGAGNPRARTGRQRGFERHRAGEIETEGLGLMARDMGYRCWGMPHLEVIHRKK